MKLPQQVSLTENLSVEHRNALQFIWQELVRVINGPFQPNYIEFDTVGFTVFPDLQLQEMVVLKATDTGNYYILVRLQDGTYKKTQIT